MLAESPVEAIGLDFVAGPGNREALAAIGGIGVKTLVAGVVDGRNVWRADLPRALSLCASLLGLAGNLVVSTSCSLLHVPLDLRAETSLSPELAGRLAFARQKVDEVVALGRALTENDAVPDAARRGCSGSERGGQGAAGRARRRPGPHPLRDPPGSAGRRPAAAAHHHDRVVPADGRDPRGPRRPTRPGASPPTTYEAIMRAEIDRVIALQEDIGLDVLVHGEPERNDMVQYFAEQLDGFATTDQRLGPVVREPVRPPADPARRRQPARSR